MAVLEAMACGLPVIGTPVGVTAELACFPASNQAEILATQAVSLFNDPAAYPTRRERASQQVIAQYSQEKMVDFYALPF
jgi:glycosyltransferase involved in cell wall biosynthesis